MRSTFHKPWEPQRHFWTHPSVLALASNSDPVQHIISLASAVTLDAMQAGWSGPPYDPFQLAEHLKIAVEPREDVTDARIIQTSDGRFRIEFNPNRPRGRVRYSVAHDLAHALFDDCGDLVRHRMARAEQKADDWQLEMLCNIGAAEFLMPLGSMSDLNEKATDIDYLLKLREQFDVSMEALLLRVVRLTEQPCAMFVASRKESGASSGRYFLDYSVFSRCWPNKMASGSLLAPTRALSDCTAIGFTAKGDEHWPGPAGHVHVECVGVPPYPSRVYPRVLGMIRPMEAPSAQPAAINMVKGDATEPRGEGRRIIAHVVNDKAALWGAGFGLAVRRKWPHVQAAFRDWVAKNPEMFRLGNVFTSAADDQVMAFEMVCQRGYGPSQKPRIRYSALRCCLERLAQQAVDDGASIHMPCIGAGQAGGSWGLVRQLVDEVLCGRGLEVTVYELPDRRIPPVQGQASLFDAKT